MKKFLFILLAILLLLTSCQSSKISASSSSYCAKSNKEYTSSDTQNSSLTSIFVNYYQQNSDITNLFNSNPIDEAYLSDKQHDNGTTGIASADEKYLKIWQNEVNFSSSNLRKLLNGSDVINFNKQQETWKNWITGSTNFDQSILDNNQYGTNMGTQREFVYTEAIINQYRERDYHLKYLTAMLEVWNAHPKPESQWTWNKFDYPKNNSSSH